MKSILLVMALLLSSGLAAESLSNLRQLAEMGDANAQYILARFYARGEGVPQDYAEAVRWYRKAAEQGSVRAQASLGLMYAKGEGVPQEYIMAHKWFNLAAAAGYEPAVENRDIAASLMTREQIAEAQKLAREWRAQ